MATVLIGYDLNRPGQDYLELITAIQELGPWWNYLDSLWLVVTALTPVQVLTLLNQHIDDGDELFVVDVTGRSWATQGLDDSANAWLGAHVAPVGHS